MRSEGEIQEIYNTALDSVLCSTGSLLELYRMLTTIREATIEELYEQYIENDTESNRGQSDDFEEYSFSLSDGEYGYRVNYLDGLPERYSVELD